MQYTFEGKKIVDGNRTFLDIPFNVWDITGCTGNIPVKVDADGILFECKLIPKGNGRYYIPVKKAIAGKLKETFEVSLEVVDTLSRINHNSPYSSSTKNADSYELDVKTMNGTDTHTLELKQGDTLKILFETIKGALEMKITAPDGTALYQGDGTAREFTVEAPMDGAYSIVVVGQKAKGSIRVDVERVTEAVESEGIPQPEGTSASEETTKPETVTLAAEDLVGPWHLAEDEKDNATAIETIPGAMEFGSSMEIRSNGNISWYIGAEGGTGTYSLSGNVLSSDMTSDFDGSPMKMEFTTEKSGSVLFLYTEYKGLLLCWSQGEDETGKGGENTGEADYPGADVVELVNLRGDTTTVYKLADGTYMDRIERRFTYNGTDTWTDEDGVEWKL